MNPQDNPTSDTDNQEPIAQPVSAGETQIPVTDSHEVVVSLQPPAPTFVPPAPLEAKPLVEEPSFPAPITPLVSPDIIALTEQPVPPSPVLTPPAATVIAPQAALPSQAPIFGNEISNPANVVVSQSTDPLASVTNAHAGLKPRRLIFVLVLAVILGGGGLAGGLALINKNQKPFKAVASTGTSTTPATPANWVAFTNTSGNFTALFPTQPTAIPQSSSTSNGVNFTVNGFQSGDTNTAYLVTYVTYPSSVTFPANTAPVLSNAAKSEANELTDGQLISSSNITISGSQAEKYEITGTKSGTEFHLTGEVTLVGHILYNVIATQSGSDAPNAVYFLSSFKVGA